MPDLPRREFIVQGSAAALAGMAGLDGSHPAYAYTIDELVAAAKTEGQLTVIALPRNWCGYGGIIDGFKAKFGLTINELSPHAGSATVIDAIRKTRGAADPPTPDVIDVGLSFITSAKKEGLLQPYKVAAGGHHFACCQGCGRTLVGRLLRRDRLRGQRGYRRKDANGLGSPRRAGV